MKLIRNNASEIKRRLAARKESGLTAAFQNEEGAIDLTSIMVGVVVIGIVAGIIAATVFAVIPWSQDQAAGQQLDAVKMAESMQYAQSSGAGQASFGDYATLKGATNASGASLLRADTTSTWPPSPTAAVAPTGRLCPSPRPASTSTRTTAPGPRTPT